MTRRPSHLPSRREFPAKVKRAVKERSGGTCEWAWGACDQPATAIDHIVPDALGGEPTLSNAMHLCPEHHDAKTAQEVRMIAKADRQAGRSGQYARRMKRDRPLIPSRPNPWPKGRKLQSKPFSKR